MAAYKRNRTIRRSDPQAGISLLKRRTWQIDIVVVPADVLMVAGSPNREVDAGATLVAGQAVYEDGVNGLKLADADAVGTAEVAGITLNGGADNQPVKIVTGGDYNPGVAVVVGVVYVLSSTAGGIAPNVDVGSGKVKVVLGIATTTSNIKLGILNSGVAAT